MRRTRSGRARSERVRRKAWARLRSPSAEEKAARLRLYLDCRAFQDLNFLKMRLRNVQREAREWHHRAHRVTSSSLRTKRHTAVAALQAQHDTQRTQLETKHKNRIAAIDAARTPDNTTASSNEKKAAVQEYRKEMNELRRQQSGERRELSRTFGQCQTKVGAELDTMLAADVESLNTQFLEKSRRLSSEYDTLEATPMTMSIRDYEQQQSTASGGDHAGRARQVDVDGCPSANHAIKPTAYSGKWRRTNITTNILKMVARVLWADPGSRACAMENNRSD